MSPRIKYFLIHLNCSLIIAIAIFILVNYIWYPTPFAEALGILPIFLMMLVIDVIIGPLLSLFVYQEGKKTLKIDLSIIVLLQLSALGYGLYNIERGRPVWIVFNQNVFEVVQRVELILDEDIKTAKVQYQDVPSKPSFAAIDRNALRQQQAVAKEISFVQQPEKFVDLKDVRTSMLWHAKSMKNLYNYNDKENIDSVLKQYAQAQAWLPLRATNKDMVVLLDNEMNVLAVVNLRPWKL